jgi:peptidoglycan hydrolase CwlO-like protein
MERRFMQTRGRRAALVWIGVALLVVSCGCASLKGKAGETAAADKPAPSPIVLASAKETLPQPTESAAEHAQQQLALAEEQRKGLALRVQQLQSVLEEKDATLAQADRELQAANAEINRTHEDLKRWKLETATLREKLRKSEDETLGALQSVVPALERMGDGK